MPYKDPEKQREYQRELLKNRRFEWIAENGPCRQCGSSENLQIDHIDKSTKISHRIWSWSKLRREVELEKCQVLCSSCHFAKTALENQRPIPHGTDSAYTKRSCRCNSCREAHRVAKKTWRKKQRAAGLPVS